MGYHPPTAYQAFIETDTTATCMVVLSTEIDGEGRGCVNAEEDIPPVVYWSPRGTGGGNFLVSAPSEQVATLEIQMKNQTIHIPFMAQGEIASVGVWLPQEPERYAVLDAEGVVVFPK